MRRRRHTKLVATALVATLLSQSGCAAFQRRWDKPWTYRSGVLAAACAAVGAGAGVGIQEARTSCATVTVDGQSVKNCQSIGDSGEDTFWLWGALIGAAAGAVVCGVLGHLFLDPTPEPYAEIPPPPMEPEPAPAPIRQKIVLRGVNFDFNSAAIRPDSQPVLDQAAIILKENPNVTVAVEGFTDSIGSAEYNQALSVRRAESVYRYLVNRGVDPERLRVEGFGKTRPIASNDTEEGRAQNRRVELHPQQQ